MRILLSILLVTISQHVFSQTLKGIVVDENNEAIIGATIRDIIQDKGTISDIDGKFELIVSESILIEISALGHTTDTLNISPQNITNEIYKVILPTESLLLNNITITAKSAATQVREQAYAVEVIESKGFKNLSTNANAILGRVSGVNIRESGGVGSDFSISLNGLSGNQVRIFLDGIPMDYFGSSLSLNNFAANLIDRIEVYKGVVPVHLSSDALGGAINVITNSNRNNYLDASLSIGSFNTQLASVNAQYRMPKSGFTQRIKSFYNRSDNNYKVPINLVNFETGKKDTFETWLNRFHDGYESKMLWYEAGFTGKRWADELMVGILHSDNYREIQQPANAIGQAQIPYGEVATEEEKLITNFSYRKVGMLNNKLSLSAYGVAVKSTTLSRDTASVRYDWYGEAQEVLDKSTGEIENRKTLLTLDGSNYLGNVNTEYALTEDNSVTLNYSFNEFTIQGNDKFKAQNTTQFKDPNEVSKQVIAGSYTNKSISENWKNTLFAKYYDYEINSLETNYSGTEKTPFKNEKNEFGWGITSAWDYSRLKLKFSYERSIRFPEIVELFGDGLNIVASPSISPENSHNYNVGLIYNQPIGDDILFISTNGFVRDADDFIIPVVQGLKVFHINNGTVLSRGVDLNVGYNLRNKVIFSFNSSYLDLRDNNPYRNGQPGLENSLYRARIPNVPYLFGNLSVSYRNNSLISDSDTYSISINQNYVHEFYYRWQALGSKNKSVVPSQYSTNLDIVYSLDDERYNISLSINNLFNKRLFDNFQQIRPGRNFNIKFRYFLN